MNKIPQEAILEKIEGLRREVKLMNQSIIEQSKQRHNQINKMFTGLLETDQKHSKSIKNIQKAIWTFGGAIAILGYLIGHSLL